MVEKKFDFIFTVNRLSQPNAYTQTEVKELLVALPNNNTEYNLSNFNKWCSGKVSIPRRFRDYYRKADNVRALADKLREEAKTKEECFFSNICTDFEKRIEADSHINAKEKQDMLEEDDLYLKIAKMICYAIINQTNSSPIISDLLGEIAEPNCCANFVGRSGELEKIESRLQDNHLLFIGGDAGIGKSELAKEYARWGKKGKKGKKGQYKNVIYAEFRENINKTIMTIPRQYTSSELDNNKVEEVFRALSELQEDSLLIIDNANGPIWNDDNFSKIENLHCRVLVTTRWKLGHEDLPYLELKKLRSEEVIELFNTYCPGKKQKVTKATKIQVRKLAKAVSNHTYAIEIIARIINTGYVDAETMISGIEYQGFCTENNIEVDVKKDGAYSCGTAKDLIMGAVNVMQLDGAQRQVLSSFTLLPTSGMAKTSIKRWFGDDNIKTVQDLVKRGWIKEQDDKIYMDPFINEVASVQLKPTGEIAYNLSMKVLDPYINKNRTNYPTENKPDEDVKTILSAYNRCWGVDQKSEGEVKKLLEGVIKEGERRLSEHWEKIGKGPGKLWLTIYERLKNELSAEWFTNLDYQIPKLLEIAKAFDKFFGNDRNVPSKAVDFAVKVNALIEVKAEQDKADQSKLEKFKEECLKDEKKHPFSYKVLTKMNENIYAQEKGEMLEAFEQINTLAENGKKYRKEGDTEKEREVYKGYFVQLRKIWKAVGSILREQNNKRGRNCNDVLNELIKWPDKMYRKLAEDDKEKSA